MKPTIRKKHRFFAELGLPLLLAILGSIMVFRVFHQYGNVILRDQDDQLSHLAHSMDSNIKSVLERWETDLTYVINRRGFLEAEEHWRETGETEPLLYRMEENLLAGDQVIHALLAISDNRILISTDGDTSYSFLEGVGMGRLRPCARGDGKLFLAILDTAEAGDIQYAALLDLDEFYYQIVGEQLAVDDWVLLMDSGCQILLHHQQGNVRIDQVDGVTSATCGRGGVDTLLSYQSQQTSGTSSYEYTDSLTGETYTARMIVLSAAESKNGAFAVGVVTNFDDVIKPLNRAAVNLMICGGMVVLGVVLIILIALRGNRQNEQSQQELALLKEKNQAMEELTKQTQELAHHQRLETIGTLTSSIAHEFNNLLTPIMGYSILTLEKLPQEEEELYDNVLEIYNASKKAKNIISRLSELSRKSTSFQNVEPNELVRKVMTVVFPAKPANVQITQQLDCHGLVIHGNETQLSQMLLNLVLNAFQAMELTGGTLTIAAWEEGTDVCLRVQDSGPGIEKEILPQIFEPFFTTKETGKGTGLGLAIVQQVVSEHQGTISVDTTPGEGTAFTMRFQGTIAEDRSE